MLAGLRGVAACGGDSAGGLLGNIARVHAHACFTDAKAVQA